MESYNRPWGIAGGWAIDLFVGHVTREHSDIEIAIFREDQQRLKSVLDDWSFKKVVMRQLVEWESETLELPIHELHGVHKTTGHGLEVLLNECVNSQWVFRRDTKINFPGSSLFLVSEGQIPFLHPVIVLLYKSKNTREKDHADFLTVKDLLDREDKAWLRNTLTLHAPGHSWITQLE
ncbi:hypothetical protein H9649_12925 [Sporosarcina sp. Sa2YVA2]|uniref:Amino acid transporter n=2 Tax=Sporosarcina quadrami TaxID=2762234 RepID=A0ABR8UBT9_9BACL|nr:hypothetical protein [Sporosarcina quadrami]